MFAVSTIGLILTAANRRIRDYKPSLAARRFIKTDTGRRTLYFSRVRLIRARHTPVPTREKSADSLFNGYLISFKIRLIGSVHSIRLIRRSANTRVNAFAHGLLISFVADDRQRIRFSIPVPVELRCLRRLSSKPRNPLNYKRIAVSRESDRNLMET